MSEVKILDAGDKLLFSGAERDDVDAKLRYFVGRGAKIVSPLSQVGTTWVAACTPPTASEDADRTSTLLLSDIAAAGQDQGPCRVESLGFKHIITGPTRADVDAKVAEMVQMGATLVTEAEESDGEWVAVCDSGGVQNTGYRWGPDAKT